MIELRQSTAVSVPVGPLVNSTTGAPETGLTISQSDVRLKKNGGNWAQKNENSNSAHEEDGMYECALDATDTDTLGQLELKVDESGTLVHTRSYGVISQAEYDRKYGADHLVMRGGTAQAGAASTITLDASASAVNDFYAGQQISIVGGTGAGQSRMITGYVGSTKVATVANAWAANPDNTSVFRVLAVPGVETINLTTAAIKAALVVRENTAQAGAAGSITLDASASAVTDFYKNQAIVITSGTGVGQIRFVSAYNGTTKVATVNENWATTPDNTSVFKVTSARALDAMLSVAGITDAVLDEPQAGHDTAGTIGWMIRQMHSRMAGKAIKTTTTGDLEFKKIDGTTKDFSHLPTTIDATHVALVPTQGP